MSDYWRITLHGGQGEILWGYHPAVVLSAWRIRKNEKGKWTLTGTVKRAEAFMARQKPLLFTAPRDKGRWAWAVESLQLGTTQLVATLGPPEQ